MSTDHEGRDPTTWNDTPETSFAHVLREIAFAPIVPPEPPGGGGDEGELVGTQVGPFRIVDWLGKGGMGRVYRAEDTRLGRTVALKLLPPAEASDATARALLLREARSAAAINHPRVATIYEVGDGESAFIAMEYVPGKTLRALAGGRPLPPEVALGHALAIAEGLSAAHAQGIVHRDLKPDNVMVSDDGSLKVLDFGIARPLRAAGPAVEPERRRAAHAMSFLSSPGQVVGTRGYMAPEQARGEPVDARADVYAFGVLLHELLTGRRPEPGGQLSAPLGGPGAPARVRRLLRRCLAPDPARRFADARELLEALRQAPGPPARSAAGVPRLAAFTGLALLLPLALMVLPAGQGQPPRPPPPAEEAQPPRLKEQRSLTANPVLNPVWRLALSPDGQRLAYSDRTGLSLLNVGTRARQPLALPDKGLWVESLSWFPDNDALLVGARQRGDNLVRLFRVPTPGGGARELDRGHFAAAALSPDGERIAFVGEGGLAWRKRDEPKQHALLTFAPGDELKSFAWSPDGRHIAYVLRTGAGESERYVLEMIALEGGARTRLVESRGLALSHDGSGLAWMRPNHLLYPLAELPPRPPGAKLWALPVDPSGGGALGPGREIAAWSGESVSLLSLDQSGHRLALLRYKTQDDVYVGALRPDGRGLIKGAPRRLTDGGYNERASGWTRDGSAVLFTSDDRSTFGAMRQPLTGPPTVLAHAADRHATWPALSPDGTSLLYWHLPSGPEGQAGAVRLMRARPDGSDPVALFTMARTSPLSVVGRPPPQPQTFRCPRKGLRCIVSEDGDDGRVTFSTFEPGGGGDRKPFLTLAVAGDVGHFGWAVSPDGRRIALPLRTGLEIYPVDGGPPEHHALRPECALRYVDWDARGDGFFVTAKCQDDDEMYQLWAVKPGQAPITLWKDSTAFLSNVNASPDGRHVAFSAKPYKNDVWLLTFHEDL
ncbi:MAG TPA: protein kinase [Polyangiaceae bacterium]|nr:protein kinase [Polyangiaceae bacterium]